MSLGVVVSEKLTNSLLGGLATGRHGVLRIKKFLTERECVEILNQDIDPQFERYDPARYAAEAYRIGPTLNEHRVPHGVSNEYWRHASAARGFWLAEDHDFVPHNWISAKLQHFLNKPAKPAIIRGQELYWGIIREMNKGTLTHWDDISLEFPQAPFDFSIDNQIALNVFISAPTAGGELVMWDQRWHPDDEEYRVGFGYTPDVIRADRCVSLRPAAGEAILFDPRNYHTVTTAKKGRRISFSTFLGISKQTLWLWS
ncbi:MULTISPECIES: hypothetical protein [unclassified Streptomyces]|uniref:2OG-Fe(II)-dependent halogenase WelO5 family protein n=1 Tax=unclassified Streptomyces TaxID=2593676 RepID=UPI00368185A6